MIRPGSPPAGCFARRVSRRRPGEPADVGVAVTPGAGVVDIDLLRDVLAGGESATLGTEPLDLDSDNDGSDAFPNDPTRQ